MEPADARPDARPEPRSAGDRGPDPSDRAGRDAPATDPAPDGAEAFYAGAEHRPFRFGDAARRALLLHGFPGTPAEMRALGRALAGEGWEARGPLLPGFGRDIERLGDTGRGDWLAAARETWLELATGAERPALIGFSMGGSLALRLATDAALPRPDPLVLIAPFTGIGDPRARLLPLVKVFVRQFKPFADADFSEPEVRAQFRRIAPELDLDDPAVQRRLRDEVTLPTAALDELRKLGDEARRAIGAVTANTVVLQGRDDATVDAGTTRRAFVALGGRLRYREIEGGHDLVRRGEAGHDALVAAVVEALGRAS